MGTISRPPEWTQQHSELLRTLHANPPVDLHSDEVAHLIECSGGFVRSVVDRWAGYPELQDDLVSVARMGVLNAIRTYKPDRGIAYSTYVVRCIRNNVLDVVRSHLRKNARMSFMPGHELERTSILSFAGGGSANEQDGERVEQQELCDRLLRELPSRCRELVCRVHGIGVPQQTKRQVAKALGLSPAQVARIYENAIAVLKMVPVATECGHA